MHHRPKGWYGHFGKRLIDLVAASAGLVVASPILIVTAIALWYFQKGQVFFLQKRPGLGGKIFTIYKFKSMTDERDESGELLPDEQRLTAIGKLVRKLSIDELLQLVNVVKGEMSLIGPRPLLVEYLDFYSPFQMRRHEILPGITGLAQIKGRNSLSWERRFRYDVFYVNNVSLKLDLLILYWTFLKVVKSDDIYFELPPGTDARFRGSYHLKSRRNEDTETAVATTENLILQRSAL